MKLVQRRLGGAAKMEGRDAGCWNEAVAQATSSSSSREEEER